MTSAELERLATASVVRFLALGVRCSAGMFLARRSPCPSSPPLPMRPMCCSTPSFPFRGRSPSSVSRTEPVSYATPFASISSRHHTQTLASVANRSPPSAPGEPATLRKHAPDWHLLDCRPSEETRPDHPKVAARYPLHSKAPPASRLVLRVHTACTQSSVSARHRHRPFGPCRRGGHVSAFALSCPRPRPSPAPKHRILSWPPWRRLRRDTPCSWSKRHTKQPRGWNRRSWTRKPFTVEPSTAGVRGHLPWGPRPSDEISLGDRCVGLPHRHLPLSGFLTLSAV